MRFVVLAVVLLLAWLFVTQTFYAVDETQFAIVTQFGQYIRSEPEPGLKVKPPFVQSVLYSDKRLLRYDLPTSALITRDKKNLVIDAYARYRITDPLLFFQNLRDEVSADIRVGDIVNSELKKEVATHDQSDIIQKTRDVLMDNVRVASNRTVRDNRLGVEVVDVRIKRADFPPTIAESIYARMNAERRRAANQFRAEGEEEKLRVQSNADREVAQILAEAERTALEVRGRAEAQSIQIFAEALQRDPEFYRFVRSLEAYRTFLQKNATLVLRSDSDLFDFLASATGRKGAAAQASYSAQ